MKLCKWLTALLLVCLALGPAWAEGVPEDVSSGTVDAAVEEEMGLALDGPEANAGEAAPAVNAVALPDAQFSAWALSHCDTDGDGQVSDAEAQAVTDIDLSDSGVKDLTGLWQFTALKSLNCAGNPVEKVDLTDCPTLANAVDTVRPTREDGCTVFRQGGAAVLTLPAATAIWLDGAALYDPASGPIVPENAAMGAKATIEIVSAEAGCPAEWCTFATSNKKVATVDTAGVVTAKKTGSVRITATAFDGRSATCAITVFKAPSKVTLAPKALSIGVGETAELTATLPAKSMTSFTWATSALTVASVEDGVVTGVSPGKATITVHTANGKKANCTVTVTAEPESMTLSPETLTLMTSQTAALKAVMLPEGAMSGITWSCTGDAISIDPVSGLITARAEGEATVTATTANGLIATCPVTVGPGPDEIVLDASSLSICVGQSWRVPATAMREGVPSGHALQYETSNKKYVTVTGDGIMTGKKKGSAKIRVSAPNGVSATLSVSVVKAPSSVKLSASTLRIGVGDSKKLTAKPSAVTWSGYDPEIVSVDEDGTVTALSAGKTTVTATSFNGKKASCKVTVLSEEAAEHKLIAVAHRGGRAYWPENTLEAFSHSASTGADMIEMDVQTTSDGVQVIHHDASFKANGKTYKIPSKSYETLKAAKPSLCTLDEALDVIYDTGLDLQLELKDSADAKKCVAAIKKHNMEDRTWYISFSTSQLKKVRAQDSEARLGYIFSGKVPKNLYSTVDSLEISALMVHQDLLTQARLDEWHDAGLMVNAWTINTKDGCRKFAQMGVDFITSDYPDYAAAVK